MNENEDDFLINNPHNLLIGLIWNVTDERLPLALSRVVEYLASSDEDLNSIDLLEIISENLMWAHDHFSTSEDSEHQHATILTEEEIEEQVQQARTILNRLDEDG